MDTRKKSFSIHVLRRGSYKWPGRNEAAKLAKVSYGTYRCALCNGLFRKKDTQLDHKIPVIPVQGFDSFDGYIDRLYCNSDGYQVLCIDCHEKKTALESGERALIRRTAKDKKKKKVVAKKVPKK